MRRRAAAALVSLLMISIFSLGFGSYMMGSRANFVQPDSSSFSNTLLHNSAKLTDNNSTTGGNRTSAPIIIVGLTAGVTLQPNGTGKCVLIYGFDPSSCVSTSVGVWKNAVLSIVANSSVPYSTIESIRLTYQQVNISEWSDSLSSQIAIFRGINSTSAIRQSGGSTVLDLYPISSIPLVINEGQILSYAITLVDGHILTGSVVAQ